MQVMPDWSLMPDNASLPPLSTSPPGRQLWQCISRLGQTVSGDIHNGDLVQMVPRFSGFLESGLERLRLCYCCSISTGAKWVKSTNSTHCMTISSTRRCDLWKIIHLDPPIMS